MLKKLIATFAVALMCAPAFAQVNFHVTGRVQDPAGGPNTNMVWITDAAGNVTGSYAQQGTASDDAWGYRDGATDGNNDVYFGWGGGINKHAADGTFLGQVVVGGGPNGTWRALAFDPTGDGGAGSLWTGDFGDNVLEVDLAGNVLNTLVNASGWSLYGLAYDDSDGNLWGHSSGGDIIKIDTGTGGVLGTYTEAFGETTVQGGLSGASELGGNIAALGQITADSVAVYDTSAPFGAGVLAAGPYDIWSQVNPDPLNPVAQNLGVAVTIIPEPTAFALIGMALAGLGMLRRR